MKQRTDKNLKRTTARVPHALWESLRRLVGQGIIKSCAEGFKNAFAEYIDVPNVKEIPAKLFEKRRKVDLYVSKEIYAKLIAIAQERNVSLSYIMALATYQYLQEG